MRVIAGTAGGLPLKIPKKLEIRPTQDKVRAAIFSMLGDQIPGARVLDLFAGIGSLGIEALSRGAKEAIFVEKDRRCLENIRQNLIFTKLTKSAHCFLQDAFDFLKKTNDFYDLIFADPPYFKKKSDQAQDFYQNFFHAVSAHLSPHGCLILEYFATQPPVATAPLVILKTKKYGETGVLLLNHPS